MIEASRRRLPVDIVVKRAFLFAWESREIFATPALILAAITILAELSVRQIFGPGDSTALRLLEAAEQVFAMAFAVGIHRFVLLAEAPSGIGFFRWDRHFVQYVLVSMLLFILILSAALMVLTATNMDPTAPSSGPTALLSLIVMPVAALVFSRLVLALPSAAAGDQMRPRQIWQATQGNGLRLIAAALITVLPFIVVEAGLNSLLPEAGGHIAGIFVTVADGLLQAARMIVTTIMLSLSYDVLIRGGGPPAR